jgi:hypothetical protein
VGASITGSNEGTAVNGDTEGTMVTGDNAGASMMGNTEGTVFNGDTWEPTNKIANGLRKTSIWVNGEIELDKAADKDTTGYGVSKIVQQVNDTLMQLGQGDSTAIGNN